MPAKRRKSAVLIILLLVLAVFLAVRLPIKTTIDRTIPLTLYRDDAAMAQTSLTLRGQLTRSLWEGQEFSGQFQLAYCPLSQDKNLSAIVYWYNGVQWGQSRAQLISFPALFFSVGSMQSIPPQSVGIGTVCMNTALDKAVIFLQDGTIAATSQKEYDKVTSVVQYDPLGGGYTCSGKPPVLQN